MEGISVQDECGKCGQIHTGPCDRVTPERETKILDKPPKLVKIKKQEKQFECDVCKKQFNTKAKLVQHKYVHSGEKPFVCATCNKGFSSKFRLVRHILIHSDTPRYNCSICSKNFHRLDHLKTHSKTHYKQNGQKCENCGKIYTSKISFRRHKAIHSVENGCFDCILCIYKGTDKNDILNHLKTIHTSKTISKEKKFPCLKCGRSFTMKKEMWRHSIVHTQNRDFLCQFCPQAYRRHDHLLRHIRKRHETPKEPTGLPNFKDAFQS